MSSYMLTQYDQWLEQPINGPLDEYAPVHDARVHPIKGNTVQLLNEFNSVYNTVELIHLTPPETPPQTPPQTPPGYFDDSVKNQYNYYQPPVVCNYQQYNQQQQQQQQQLCVPVLPSAQQYPSLIEQAINLIQSSNEYVNYDSRNGTEIDELDELVDSRAEAFIASSIDDDSSSYSGSSLSCFSPHSEISTSTTDDSDWTPSAGASQNNKSRGAVGNALKAKPISKRKPRLNRRSHEDRQSRKKEQNKSAANRYRLKKKAEIEILCDEEQTLMKQNEKLSAEEADVNRELKVLKSLLRDLFRAKGLIK